MPRGRKPLANTWRQRGLPGVNESIPVGGKGIVATPGYIGRDKLTRLLRTLDNTRDVAELAPFGEAADAWLEAAATQLAATYGECGPSELAILRGAARQLFWAEVLMAKAHASLAEGKDGNDPKLGPARALVETATRITDSYVRNVVAAHKLRADRAAVPPAPTNPLAAFDAGEETEDETAVEVTEPAEPTTKKKRGRPPKARPLEEAPVGAPAVVAPEDDEPDAENK